jgi:hypothetical protein
MDSRVQFGVRALGRTFRLGVVGQVGVPIKAHALNTVAGTETLTEFDHRTM